MRKIEFRVWNKTRKKMYYPDHLTFAEYEQNWVVITMWEGEQQISCYFLDLIPLQHIGHKDKNGKKIYKGDIVKYDKVIGVVEWDNSEQGGARFYIKTFDWHSESYFDVCWKERWSALKVIGNICENLELLEGKEE